MQRITFLSAAAVISCFSIPAMAFTGTAFGPAQWQASDATLGVSGFAIENFEDTALAPGLQVSVSTGNGSYGPTSTLPFLFDPAANDPNGLQVFVPGIWDGTHTLVNRINPNVPVGYVDPPAWGNVTFHLIGGARSFGVSIEQQELGLTVQVNGVDFAPPAGFLVGGGGRQGYLRIDAGAGEQINTVAFLNSGGDGLVYDHVAFNVPEPGVAMLLFGALGGIGLQRRSRP